MYESPLDIVQMLEHSLFCCRWIPSLQGGHNGPVIFDRLGSHPGNLHGSAPADQKQLADRVDHPAHDGISCGLGYGFVQFFVCL
jgi:hypothetical protein